MELLMLARVSYVMKGRQKSQRAFDTIFFVMKRFPEERATGRI